MAKRAAESIPTEGKRKCVSQRSILKFFKPEGTSASELPSSSGTVITPDFYGIRLFDDTDISSATGLQKEFRSYWNEKAHEICADRSIRGKLQSKAAIQGTIYTSWTLHKTHLLQLQVDELQEEAKKIYRDDIAREHALTAVTKNSERMQQAYACTTVLGESISSLAGDEKKVKEVELEKAMTELKKAQDALSKALERRKADLLAAMKDVEERQIITTTPAIQLSDSDMEELIETVKNESTGL